MLVTALCKRVIPLCGIRQTGHMLKYITVEKRKSGLSGEGEKSPKMQKREAADAETVSSSATASGGDAGFKYSEVKGDLFKCSPDESLAHCISADVHMGKGIATIFKKQFGGVQELRDQRQQPGGLATLKRRERFIYYLVTKEKYWQKPTYGTLSSSLKAMKDHSVRHDVRKIAMPKIGCGLDRLQWDKVSSMIKETFGDTSIQITVYYI